MIPNWDNLPVNEIEPNKRVSDQSIWRFAKANHYHILTFDEDFVDLQNLYSYPPKIIWLRLGNCSTKEIAAVLTALELKIIDFIKNDEVGIFEIYL